MNKITVFMLHPYYQSAKVELEEDMRGKFNLKNAMKAVIKPAKTKHSLSRIDFGKRNTSVLTGMSLQSVTLLRC